MGEKRFKKMDAIIDPFPIWDTVEEKGYNCTDTLDLLVGLLNTQQDTIERLQDLCGESDYENAKLRLKNKELQDKIDWLCERYGYNGDGV